MNDVDSRQLSFWMHQGVININIASSYALSSGRTPWTNITAGASAAQFTQAVGNEVKFVQGSV